MDTNEYLTIVFVLYALVDATTDHQVVTAHMREAAVLCQFDAGKIQGTGKMLNKSFNKR